MKIRLLLFTLIALFFVLFATACDSSTSNKQSSSHSTQTAVTTTPPIQSSATTTSVPTRTTTPTATMPVITTTPSCPQQGTARPAIMPVLQTGGNDQNIVYLTNTLDGGSGPSGGGLFFLKRYDVQTRTTNVILNLRNSVLETAQISSDGQWILFNSLSLVNSQSELQLVRIDGQYLQTLYCAPANQQIDPTHTTGLQWSPDQKQIIFNQGASVAASQTLYLLQVNTGNVQQEMTASAGFLQFFPRTWMDNTHVFIIDTSGSNVLLLDTGKGPNQDYNTMQRFIGPHDFTMDFDSSYDAKDFFMSTYLHQGTAQCSISIEPIGNITDVKTINCNTLAVNSLRVISKSTAGLLLQVYAGTSGNPNNGLWKINTNGTGLTHLTISTGDRKSVV